MVKNTCPLEPSRLPAVSAVFTIAGRLKRLGVSITSIRDAAKKALGGRTVIESSVEDLDALSELLIKLFPPRRPGLNPFGEKPWRRRRQPHWRRQAHWRPAKSVLLTRQLDRK